MSREWTKTNYLNRFLVETPEVNEDVADRNQDVLKVWTKTQGSWVVEIG
jgi:hypothetical protein